VNQRIVDLETRLAYDERTLEELNDLVYRQQQTIDRLVEDVARLREQLRLLAPSLVLTPDEDSPPPHW